jgi:hypothetical protein
VKDPGRANLGHGNEVSAVPAITARTQAGQRDRGADPAQGGAPDSVAAPRALLALSAKDHYVRVTITAGETLVLIRLGDAMQ